MYTFKGQCIVYTLCYVTFAQGSSKVDGKTCGRKAEQVAMI